MKRTKLKRKQISEVIAWLRENNMCTGRYVYHRGQYWFQVEGQDPEFPKGFWKSESQLRKEGWL